MTAPFGRGLSRRSLLGTAGAAGLAGLAGCAAGTSTPAQQPDGTASPDATTSPAVTAGSNAGSRLTILAYASDFPTEQLTPFAEANNCQVVIEEYTFDKLTAMLASNRAPDLVLGAGGFDTPYLAVNEIAEPLDERLASSTVIDESDLADINNLWRYENDTQGTGPIYGLVKDYSNDLTLWVNAELIGRVPEETEVWTYDELRETAEAATKESSGRVETYGYEFYDDKPHIMHVEGMMASAGTSLFNDGATEIDLSQDAGVRAIDFFRQLIEKRATPSSLSQSSSNTWQLFQAGRLAVLQSGYWTQGMFSDYEDVVKNNLYMLPAPQLGSERVSPVMAGTGLWMPRGAKQKDLAWTFMEYYFGGEPATERASSGWGVPALKSLESLMPTETDINRRALATQQGEMEYFRTLTFTPYARVSACNTLMLRELENGVRDGKSTADICGAINTAINDTLRRGQR